MVLLPHTLERCLAVCGLTSSPTWFTFKPKTAVKCLKSIDMGVGPGRGLASLQQKEKINKNLPINKNKTHWNKNYFQNSRTRLWQNPHMQTNHCHQQM